MRVLLFLIAVSCSSGFLLMHSSPGLEMRLVWMESEINSLYKKKFEKAFNNIPDILGKQPVM